MMNAALLFLTLASPAAAPTVAPSIASASAPVSEPAPVSAPSPTYFVLSPKGVLEVDTRGKAVRVVSASRASAGRRLPGDAEALVYVPEALELRRLNLTTGNEKVVIRLPKQAPTCTAGETIPTRELDVQSPSDLLLDAPRAACLTLMDRNFNMASYGLTVYANLAGGPHRVTPSLGNCPDDKGPWCKRDMSVKPGRPAPRRLPGLPESVVAASTSPSGRWTLVWFVSTSGDYIYLSYYLLDNTQKNYLGIPEANTPWRARITTAELAQVASEPEGAEGEYAEESEGGPPRAPVGAHLATQVVIGETEARWTGNGDTFVLGNLLVDPSVSVVDLGGAPL